MKLYHEEIIERSKGLSINIQRRSYHFLDFKKFCLKYDQIDIQNYEKYR